jgi:hypothetical protein
VVAFLVWVCGTVLLVTRGRRTDSHYSIIVTATARSTFHRCASVIHYFYGAPSGDTKQGIGTTGAHRRTVLRDGQRHHRDGQWNACRDGAGVPIEVMIQGRRPRLSEAARLTRAQLSHRMGTQAVIARLESGRTKPSTRTLERLATGMRLRISFEPIGA